MNKEQEYVLKSGIEWNKTDCDLIVDANGWKSQKSYELELISYDKYIYRKNLSDFIKRNRYYKYS